MPSQRIGFDQIIKHDSDGVILKTFPFNQVIVFQNEPQPDLKMLLGRAFLLEVESGDRDMMILFARAFLVHALMNGTIRGTAS
ncbi:MAG: hypothetical protein V3U09_08100 [Thermoplasmata archaeon]